MYKKEELISRVLDQPTGPISSVVSHDNMDVITKVMFMYTICNVVPRKEGREKVATHDYLLINQAPGWGEDHPTQDLHEEPRACNLGVET